METVFIQIKAPRGSEPGRILEGHYNVVGDTVVLRHLPWRVSGGQQIGPLLGSRSLTISVRQLTLTAEGCAYAGCTQGAASNVVSSWLVRSNLERCNPHFRQHL